MCFLRLSFTENQAFSQSFIISCPDFQCEIRHLGISLSLSLLHTYQSTRNRSFDILFYAIHARCIQTFADSIFKTQIWYYLNHYFGSFLQTLLLLANTAKEYSRQQKILKNAKDSTFSKAEKYLISIKSLYV